MLKEEFEFIAHGPLQGPAQKLVVLLHGYGVNAGYMDKVAQAVLERIPEALVLCPQAPGLMDLPPEDQRDDLTVAPPEEARNPPEGLNPEQQREWFEITHSLEGMNEALLALAERLNCFIDDKRDDLGIEDRDIALMGFSQGGTVALYTACTRQEAVGCAVAHSTIVMDTKGFTAQPPVLFIYGNEDKSFSMKDFEDKAVKPLQSYVTDLQVREVKGLGHRTNTKSRAITADYIANKLSGPR
ncbi:MAG: dienelactone hydrolase family protein [Rhodospirillales bacterium]|nr:dienelactone hydrolase family protein [Rhodospirillales bacterium]MCB9996878.1 dienelactone hydrolase family protein [Rhodospirillales bacterium]